MLQAIKKNFISSLNAHWPGLAGMLGTSCNLRSIRRGDSRLRSTELLRGPGEVRILCPSGSWYSSVTGKGWWRVSLFGNPPEPEGGNGSRNH